MDLTADNSEEIFSPFELDPEHDILLRLVEKNVEILFSIHCSMSLFYAAHKITNGLPTKR